MLLSLRSLLLRATTALAVVAAVAIAATPAEPVTRAARVSVGGAVVDVDVNGEVVVVVAVDDAFAKAGFAAGDIIKDVNGVDVDGAGAFLGALVARSADHHSVVRVVRGDNELLLQLPPL